MAAEDDRPEPLQEYVARGRSWKFMAVIEHAVRRGATADGEGGAAGGVFGNEIVDMLIGLYQVRLIDFSPWPLARYDQLGRQSCESPSCSVTLPDRDLQGIHATSVTLLGLQAASAKTFDRRCWVRQMGEPQPSAGIPSPRFSGAARYAFPRSPTSGCKSGRCSSRRRGRPRRRREARRRRHGGGGGGDWKAGSQSLLRRGELAGFPTAAEPPRRRPCGRATWDGERLGKIIDLRNYSVGLQPADSNCQFIDGFYEVSFEGRFRGEQLK